MFRLAPVPQPEPHLSPAELRARATEAQDHFLAKVTALASATDEYARDEWAQLLSAPTWLIPYSFRNQLFIGWQCPHATWVKSRREWADRGRTIRPGARPLMIAAPSNPRRGFPFIGVPVFDVSQTDGPPVPDPTAYYRGNSRALPAIEAAAARLGVEVVDVAAFPGPRGHLTLGQARPGLVEVRAGLADLERTRVLVHEYAHLVLHLAVEQRLPDGRMRGTQPLREAEADATAFLVCDALGVRWDCREFLFRQHLPPGALVRHFKRIVAAARLILSAITEVPSRARLSPMHASAGVAPRCCAPRAPRTTTRA